MWAGSIPQSGPRLGVVTSIFEQLYEKNIFDIMQNENFHSQHTDMRRYCFFCIELMITSLVAEQGKSCEEHLIDAARHAIETGLGMAGAAAAAETGNLPLAVALVTASGFAAQETLNDLQASYRTAQQDQNSREGCDAYCGDREYESKQNDRDSDLR